MASPPLEVEDQLDEEFFDKLVNDDDDFDFTGSISNPVIKAADSVGVKGFSNLSITETSSAGVVSGEKDIDLGLEAAKDGGGSALLDANKNTKVANERSSAAANVNELNEIEAGEQGVSDIDLGLEATSGGGGEDGGDSVLLDANENTVVANEISSTVGAGEEGVLDNATDESAVASANGVKEVQWSSFNSDSDVQSVGGFRAFSEIFNNLEDNSEDPFAEVGNKDDLVTDFNAIAGLSGTAAFNLVSSSHLQNNDVQYYGVGSEQNVVQDLSNSQYWENMYPGWRYDPNTSQWYQVEGYDVNSTMNMQESLEVTHSASHDLILNQAMDAYTLQQTAQSFMGTSAENFGNYDSSKLNQISQGNVEYPAHMVFDPQYPGWYYDTIAQEWKMMDLYSPAVDQSANTDYNQQYQSKSIEGYEPQTLGSQDYAMSRGEFVNNYHQQDSNSFQAYSYSNEGTEISSETKQPGNLYSPSGHLDNHSEQQSGFGYSRSDKPSQTFLQTGAVSSFQSFIPAQSYNQFNNQTTVQPDQQMQFRPAFIDPQKPGNHPQQQLQIGTSFYSSSNDGRSSAGRPPHALVTFGFGGKLVVMRNSTLSYTTSVYGNQGLSSTEGVVEVLNLMEVVKDNSNASSFGYGSHYYFQTLCHQSFPGPLVGGNSGNKELYKWIDERIADCESSMLGSRGEVLRLLFSLLKISCQYYGKFRSPFGSDHTLKESDCPELAVAALLGSVKGKRVQSSAYGALMNLPLEAQMQATASEVQKLLVSGRKKEALEFAQQGQLWGLALVIASQLGDQFYRDTVKLMALKQLTAGSPLRTLCLLSAGHPADVFSTISPSSNLPGYVNTPNQPGQIGAIMLDGWEENLAIITANRTKGDELVVIHLGDCLWKERGEVAAAHICYLVAETNFEPYSDGARLCLIGADHWSCPRTYVSPEAIQRTELYEYSKVLGNSQFLLLPFQPYKLIYAYMLAEVGKVAESLKYCQVILKSLRTGQAPEVETWKQLVSSLEERLRMHQQGGYNTLAPTKLVGKLLTFFDNTAHRVVGGPPPPMPSTFDSSFHQNEFAHQPQGSNLSSSQPMVAMQSLTSSMLTLQPQTSSMSTLQPQTSSMLTVQPQTSSVSTLRPQTSSMSTLQPQISSMSTLQPQTSSMTTLQPQISSMSMEPTMAMPSLMVPSASMEPINERSSQTDLLAVPSRSISEPAFAQSDSKVDSSNKANSPKTQGKAAVSSGSSRLGRFGSRLFQKTVGLVMKSQPDRQAKLGEANKFYYDEKLKRWVEEGAEPPAEETALPPPPTTATFQNGMNDVSMKNTPKIEGLPASSDDKSSISSDQSSGIPSIPPSSNQYSARARMGVRSRYVDTFNKSGGSPVNLFQSPPVPSAKPLVGSSPKFFIPSPVTPTEEMVENSGETVQEAVLTNEGPTSVEQDSSPVPSSSTLAPASLPQSSLPVPMQHFPSMDNIVQKRIEAVADNDARRTASWSGSLSDATNLSTITPLVPSSSNANSNTEEELHEIKL